MGDNRRILVATIASMVILFAWQKWIMPPPPKKPAVTSTATPGTPTPTPTASPQAAAPTAQAAPAVAPDAPEERVTLETPEFRAELTSRGGALASLVLKGDKFRRDEHGKVVPVNLVRVAPGQPLPLSIAVGPELGGAARAVDAASVHAPMRVVAKDEKSVTFEGTFGAASLRKRVYVTSKPYELGVDLEVHSDRPGTVGLVYSGYVSPDAPKPGLLSGGAIVEAVTPLCRAGESTVRGKDPQQVVPGTPRWVGIDQHYFVSAILPAKEAGECVLDLGPTHGAVQSVLRLPVDRETTASFTVYAGPKQVDLLQGYGRELDSAVDYGAVANLFAFFARMLLWIMRQLHAVVANWGVAIILLTFLVKLVLYPLTAKSMQSMNEMRKLQPEIEKLKQKFGNDREKLNVATMQLYQQHKVNPLGGCLPMLLQMPIWFALYATLQTSVELYREPFLWIHDLTQYDPYYILPLTMGVSSFVMQRLSPQPADNTQAKMLLYFMPIFFTFIMLKLPAGLTLYILVNNLLSIAQQQYLMRRHAPPAPQTA